MARRINDLNIGRIFARSPASQNFTLGGYCLQCDIIDLSRNRCNVSTHKSRNRLPFSVDVDHCLQILRHTLRTTTTGRRQLDFITRRQQNASQRIAIGLSIESTVGSIQRKPTSCQGHAIWRRRGPVSVLTRLSTCKVASFGLCPQEVLGSHYSTGSLRSCHLRPTSFAINCNGLRVSVLKQNLSTRGVGCHIHLDAILGEVTRSLVPLNPRVLRELHGILFFLNPPQLSCRRC